MEESLVYSISSLNSKDNGLIIALLAKAKTGDQAAFGQLYDLYFKKIYQFIYYRVGHKQLAEDLAEDVFLKAYGKLVSLNKNSSFEGWLYQIARNLVIDYYREKKLTVALGDVENTLEYETNIIDTVNLNQQQKILLKLLKELGEEQQIVIKLKFFEDLDNGEIAALLNKSEGAIRVIQHRAIIKLQELIKKSQDSENESNP